MKKTILTATMLLVVLITGCRNESVETLEATDFQKSLEFIILEDEAVSAATDFLNKGKDVESRSAANAKVETIWRNIALDGNQSRNATEGETVEVPVYVVSYTNENDEPNGYVVTVGDKRVIDRVLVFSDDGNWDLSGIPEFEEIFWDNVDNSLTQTLSESDIDMCDTYEYEEQGEIEEFAVNLFLTWGQSGSPYNDSIPWCSSTNSNMPAGCGPVAIGQIMAYHNYPNSGTYIHPRYNRTVNASYNWTQMKASTDARQLPVAAGRSGVANLLAEIGYKSGTTYGCDGSGTNIYSIPTTFRNMGYSCDVDDFILSHVIDDIDNSQPVLLYGFSSLGGHAWVVEGYRQTVNNLIYGRDCPDGSESIPPTVIDYSVLSNYLYFNLGWHNNSNGFYLADTFQEWDLPQSVGMVYNIKRAN